MQEQERKAVAVRNRHHGKLDAHEAVICGPAHPSPPEAEAGNAVQAEHGANHGKKFIDVA